MPPTRKPPKPPEPRALLSGTRSRTTSRTASRSRSRTPSRTASRTRSSNPDLDWLASKVNSKTLPRLDLARREATDDEDALRRMALIFRVSPTTLATRMARIYARHAHVDISAQAREIKSALTPRA